MDPWIAVGALALVALAIPLGMIAVSSLLRPTVSAQGKTATYESGEVPTGTARVRFNIQYYMVALLFVVFDVETVLIFPWTVVYRNAIAGGADVGAVLAPMLLFIGVLVVGLVWAWSAGAIEWVRSPRANRQKTERQP